MDMFRCVCLLFCFSVICQAFAKDDASKDSVAEENITTEEESADEKEAEDVEAITEVSFGSKQNDEFPVIVYISPSCLHCGKFIVGEFDEFVKRNKDKHLIILRFLPTSAKDIFIMKILQNEAKNANGFFMLFTNYIKRCLATIDRVTPTKEQEEKFRGSNADPEMIKFQVVASEFGFLDQNVIDAIPDVDEPYEKKLIKHYGKFVESISDIVDTKNINLPLIMKGDTVLENLNNAYDD